MARTTIHLMQHDEVHNPGGILYGRLPGYHLSTLGHQMAQQVADVLSASGHDITQVITSSLERARETGAPTAAAFGLAPTTEARLIEAGSNLEGIAVNRNRWTLAHPSRWSSYVNPLRPSWGEPYREIVERMRGAVVSALDLAEGHEALLVSHQLPIWSLRLFLERRPPAEHSPKGECLLIVAGAAEDAPQEISQEQILAEIDLLVEAGSKKNQAIKEVAKKYGRNKSELYAVYHELRES